MDTGESGAIGVPSMPPTKRRRMRPHQVRRQQDAANKLYSYQYGVPTVVLLHLRDAASGHKLQCSYRNRPVISAI